MSVFCVVLRVLWFVRCARPARLLRHSNTVIVPCKVLDFHGSGVGVWVVLLLFVMRLLDVCQTDV